MKTGPKPRPLRERFLEKIQRSDICWIWTGGKTTFGYGVIWDREVGHVVLAHRVAFEFLVGPIPLGLEVCHLCDSPPCVNPDHLFLGTHEENMRDMVVKRRSRAAPSNGERNGRSKLAEEDIPFIRHWMEAGYGDRAVSKAFGVARFVAHEIKHGRLWAHVR